MRTLLLITAFTLSALFTDAQTLHNISAGGGPAGPTPFYSPQFITINVGDTVRWTNTGGSHNVDGSLATYPNNPEGFRNGPPSSNLWVYDKVFTIPGFYEFSCEQSSHAQTQFGSITVMGSPTGINENEEVNVQVYPNPVTDELRIRTDRMLTRATLYTVDMQRVSDMSVDQINSEYIITLSGTASGIYIVQLDLEGNIVHEKIVVN